MKNWLLNVKLFIVHIPLAFKGKKWSISIMREMHILRGSVAILYYMAKKPCQIGEGVFPPLLHTPACLILLAEHNHILPVAWRKCLGMKNIFDFQTSAHLWEAARSCVTGDCVDVSDTLLASWKQNRAQPPVLVSAARASGGFSAVTAQWHRACPTAIILLAPPAVPSCWGSPAKSRVCGTVLLGRMGSCHQQNPCG